MINADDGDGLHTFALRLISCANAMTGMDYMAELDTTANMCTIVNKLLYKLKLKGKSSLLQALEQREGARNLFSSQLNLL